MLGPPVWMTSGQVQVYAHVNHTWYAHKIQGFTPSFIIGVNLFSYPLYKD